MMNRPAFCLCVVLIALSNVIRTTEMADGAELRSTRGERVIVRQVSTAAESPDATPGTTLEAPLPGEPAIEMYSPGELDLAADSYVVEPNCVSECSPCDPCRCDGFWFDAEFLLWWRKDRCFPPLVTRAVPAFPSPTPPPAANSLSIDEAPVVFGGGPIEEHGQPGGRLNFGMWFDGCRQFGMGGRFVGVGDASVAFADASDGADIGIGRPYYDTNANLNTAVIIAGGDNVPPRTNASSGWIRVGSDSEVLAGDLYYRLLMHENCRIRTDFIFGYQFSRLDEDLTVDAFTDNPTIGTWRHTDAFRAKNEYHGGHFGFQGEYRHGCWGLELLTKFAFGKVRQTVAVQGVGEFTDLTPDVFPTSGLLAQAATNAGTHVQDEFSFMEDIKIALAYWPTPRLKISAGYSLMYWSSVVRPGEHIDFGVDGRLLLNPAPPADAVRPTFAFRPTGFFLHGLNLGMEYRF